MDQDIPGNNPQDNNSGNNLPAFPYYGPPAVYVKPPRRRRPLIISLIAVLLAAVITVTAILVLNPPYRLQGNAGVVAAYEYFCEYMKQSERMTSGTAGGDIGKRLGAEPFEIECALNISSDQFEDTGIPLKSIPVGIDIKYDMTDLGMQVSAMGFQVLSAYVISDEFVVNIADSAGSEKIDLPVKANLSEPMTLPDRFAAFLPFLAKDNSALYMKILEAFAQSVPDEYTSTYTLEIYSPAAGRDVKTLVVETELDTKAIAEVVHNFAGQLREDKELVKEIQAIADEIADYLDLEHTDINQKLDEMENADESSLNGAALSWEVYKRNGRYSGMSVTAQQSDTGSTTFLSEFDNNVFYTSYKIESEMMTGESYTVNTYNGNRMEIEAKTTIESEYMASTSQQSGTVEYTRTGAGEYAGDIDITIDQSTTYTSLDDTSQETQTSTTLTGDIEFRFGDDLKTLKDSPRWNDIYDMEWGTLEDAMQGIFDLGPILGGNLNIL